MGSGAAGGGVCCWAKQVPTPIHRANTCMVRIDIRSSGLRKRRRWNSALGGLLKRESELEQTRLAARHARETDAERRRFCIESGWKRRRRSVQNHSEGDDDGRIAGLGGD